MTNFFLYCIKKMSFSGSPKGTPHDWCRRTMKKNYPEPKKCSICWVSHMFSIWEYRYSYGICFGTVYALQNSTPNISTPNILSIFFSVHTRRVEIGHILCIPSGLYIYIYISSYKTGWFCSGKCWQMLVCIFQHHGSHMGYTYFSPYKPDSWSSYQPCYRQWASPAKGIPDLTWPIQFAPTTELLSKEV